MAEPWAAIAAEMERIGWRVYRRRCSNPTIRGVNMGGDVVDIVPAYEVRCGCGYAGINAAGMHAVYERHLAQAAIDSPTPDRQQETR